MATVLVLILLFLNLCYCANILILSNLPSPSHHIWHKGYALALIKNGHNITMLTNEEESEKNVNFTVITLENIYPKLKEKFNLEQTSTLSPLKNIDFIINYELFACEHDFTTIGLKRLLNYPKSFKFDLIILNLHTGRCLYPLIDIFNSPPIIGTSPFGNQPYIGYIFGNSIASTIPFYHFHTTDKMDFYDRLINFFYIHYLNFMWRCIMIPKEYAMAKKYFGSNMKQIHEYERKISLLLANSDPVLNYPQNIYPNIIPVAGIHILPPKELPKDVKEILDSAKRGVVLVAFGTNLNFDKMEAAKREAFLKAFAKLPQTILLKTNNLNIVLPKNVITSSWLPQNDILAHPNVRLFITHGGALGTQEAMYHGVPIVGMPFFLDQHGNMAKIEIRKLGKTIKYSEVTFATVYKTIKEVLENPSYRSNMQQLARRFRDQPQTPMERALFWTEYVLRHKDVDYLSPRTRDMDIFQRLDLDIYLIILGFIGIIIAVAIVLFKKIVRCFKNITVHKVKKN